MTLRLIVVGLAVALAGSATAADHPVAGSRLRLRDQRQLRDGVAQIRRTLDVSAADAAIALPLAGSALDPSLVGAALLLLDAGGGGEAARIELPASGWALVGKTWRHRASAKAAGGSYKITADLSAGRLRASVQDKGAGVLAYTLDEPAQGGLAAVLELGSERYCTAFGAGSVVVDAGTSDAACNSRGAFLAKAAAPPAACASAVPVARDVCDTFELLDRLIDGQMAASGIPGLGAAVLRGGEVVWTRGYGERHVSPSRPVLAETPFMLASISKTVTATAVLQLVEDGVIALDEDIDDILDFPVDNPRVPGDEVITVRHLLTHTSGLADDESVWGGYPGEPDSLYVLGDSPIALRDFMVGYFTPGGAWYDATKNFTASPPGTHYLYSNLATALLGYLVEAATGTSLDDHSDARIFAPLSMADTGWHLADFAPRDVAMPYESVGGELYEWGLFGYPDYPDGQLRSSAADLARFLAAWAGGGTYDGAQILAPATVAEALTVQLPAVDATQGLSWYYDTIGARTVVGHNGSDYGTTTDMFFDPSSGHGVIVLINTDDTPARLKAMARIEEALFALAETP